MNVSASSIVTNIGTRPVSSVSSSRSPEASRRCGTSRRSVLIARLLRPPLRLPRPALDRLLAEPYEPAEPDVRQPVTGSQVEDVTAGRPQHPGDLRGVDQER